MSSEVIIQGFVEQRGEQLAFEHALSDVDHFNRLRNFDGSHDQATIGGIYINKIAGVKETSMPHAVSTIHQEYIGGQYMWLDQTPEQVAESGYTYHRAEAALLRVDVEREEALDVSKNLRPGFTKVFLSPKMSRADAPYKVAKSEHLADEDMVRTHTMNVNENGEVVGKYMQSASIREIPLDVWVRMLRDPNNIFGKSVEIDNEESALSVMKTHAVLEVAEEDLPEGVLSILSAALPYMDYETRERAENQLALLRCNQAELHEKAEFKAAQWMAFDMDLADSLYTGYANEDIIKFIDQLSEQWNDDFLAILESQREPNGQIRMSRALATELELARCNTLWIGAAVSSGNQTVIKELVAKVGKRNAQEILENEIRAEAMARQGHSIAKITAITAVNTVKIAKANMDIGGGCPGLVKGSFNGLAEAGGNRKTSGEEDCDYISKECPLCKAKNVKTHQTATKITCGTCNQSVKIESGPEPKNDESDTEELTNITDLFKIDNTLVAKIAA